ncbi:NCS2 family permease [Novosphingobium rosa]|uniref:NCS2 family permease n=1 Tax=Novosphingobium rosa TaxID=76978 RepID=UPI000829C67A|nr:NCS2 family permease [Novosphingobium rosa]
MTQAAPTSSSASAPSPLATLAQRHFALAQRGSSVRTEVVAGLTSFFTMAYIIVVNPGILGLAGMPVAAVAAATCLSAALACMLMGVLANAPLGLAPGMGLNAYFSFTVVQAMHVPWQVALGCVFISGVAFLLLTAAGIRQMIVAAIPPHLLAAVAGGIGLFIAFIGLKNADLVVASPATVVALGDLHKGGPLLALIGLAIMAGLSIMNVRAAILIGIVATTLIGWVTHLVPFAPAKVDTAGIGQTIMALDLNGALHLDGKAYGLGLLEVVFVFLFVDLFDNIGTLCAVTKRAGLINPDGSIRDLNRMLYADAIATMAGSMIGTSTVTSYVESTSGVEAGGRTGLTAIVCGLMFLIALPFAPYAAAVPLAATAPALVLVGALMMAPLQEVSWERAEQAVPAFLTLVMIPLTFSIANGLAFGITAHAAIKIMKREVTRSDWLLLVLAVLFILRFAYIAAA